MTKSAELLALATATLLTTTATTAQEREMGVSQGPETVFDRPVGTIFGALIDARPTGQNGRVGNELVFWEYRLVDETNAFLVACANVFDVDCEARLALVCPTEYQELDRVSDEGLVNQRNCREIFIGVGPDAVDGCLDREQNESLSLWLIQCQG